MNRYTYQYGLSLIELMIALALGLFIIGTTIGVYLAQTQLYKTNMGMASIQNAENAISAFITPIVRSAGFSSCNTVNQASSNLNPGGSPPLGSLNTTPAMVMGYKAISALGADNAPNDNNASHWSPSLDSTLVGNVESGSDVLVLLGASTNASPIGVTRINTGENYVDLQNTTGLTVGQYAAVSDCVKTAIFKITGVSGTTVTHAAGSGSLNNASDTLNVNFPIGSQLIPLQQTAFFIGQGHGGQSALIMATLNGSAWTVQPLVPGVQVMLVKFGIGSNGIISQYVTANNVSDWSKVYSIQLGFIIEGPAGSNLNQTQLTVLGNTISVPNDSRLRQVFEMTINMRNALS